MGKNSTYKQRMKKKDDIFVKKILFQFVICIITFAALLINSKLPFEMCKSFNNTIKHYLSTNADFKEIANTAQVRFKGLLEQIPIMPVNNSIDTLNSEHK